MTSMDVDTQPVKGDGVQRKTLDIHPLALVHMSDQYTRIKCGGSVLSVDSPVVGLLFGKDGTIHDAEDIPISATDPTAKQQVSLHQAVFPQHAVVGWYRVDQNDAAPTAQDVRITQSLQQLYATDNFCFLLLQVSNGNGPEQTKEQQEQLPLSIYRIHANGSVLVEVPDWQLATTEPERIAIERVVRELPTSAKENQDSGKSSAFATKLNTVEKSLESMKERVDIIMASLKHIEDTQDVNHQQMELMREVQGLVCQLGALSTCEVPDKKSVQLLCHLGAVAKTVYAIQGYTDKVRAIAESRNPRASRDTSASGVVRMSF